MATQLVAPNQCVVNVSLVSIPLRAFRLEWRLFKFPAEQCAALRSEQIESNVVIIV